MNVIRRTLRSLLELDDSAEHIALSFAIGVCVGFSPLLGLHTVIGLALAFRFSLNKFAVMVGVFANTPWIYFPFYAFSAWFGTLITGLPEGITLPPLGLREFFQLETWQRLAEQWRLLIPALVGSSILCLLLGCVSYPLSLAALRRFRAKGFISGPTNPSREVRP